MASAPLARGSRLLSLSSSPILSGYKNVAVCAGVQIRLKSDDLQQMKHGRGGRSSFTGNVVTVFGSNGFVARYVINRLAKEGNQVIVAYRGEPYEVQRLKVCGDLGQIVFVPFELRDQASILKCLKYSNWAINLVGKDWETKNFTFDDVHHQGARAIAKACAEAGIDKFIHFSALGASPDPPRKLPKIRMRLMRWLCGGSWLPNGSEWLRSKFHGEVAVREEFPNAIIFRPSDIMGHEDRFLRYYNTNWRRSIFNVVPLYKKGIETVKAPIAVADIATAVMHAFKSKHIYGQTFQCTGPHFYQLSEIIDYFLECTMYHTTHRRVGFMHPKSLPLHMFCAYMEILFLCKPVYTFERFERDSISDVLVEKYPTIKDCLPKDYKLTPIEKIAPYELKFLRAHNYYYSTLDVADPDPPVPLVLEDD